MNNLALTLRDQGDLAGARDFLEQVVETRTRVLGPEHPDTFTATDNLAFTLLSIGDYAGTRELLEQAVATRTRVLGPEHPDTLRVTHNLALTLWYQGDLAAARVLLEQVVETSTRVLGPEHPDTLMAMGSLDYLLATTRPLSKTRSDRRATASDHAPMSIRVAQAPHHGTDHRSQICTVLTTLGL